MKLKNAIRELIELRGINILHNSRFTNYLDDYKSFSNDIANKSIVKQFHSSIFMDKLICLYKQRKDNNINKDCIKHEISKIKNQFVISTGITQFLADDVVDAFAYGLELEEEPSPYLEQYLGQWDMTYDNEKELHMIIDIKLDNSVETSSSSKYLWEILNDGSINIYIPNMVSYIGKVESNMIIGKANNHINYKQWAWHANKTDNALYKTKLYHNIWELENEIDLESDVLTFQKNGILISKNYNQGKWILDKFELTLITANEFITYKGRFSENEIHGKARNKVGRTWNFTLKQKKY